MAFRRQNRYHDLRYCFRCFFQWGLRRFIRDCDDHRRGIRQSRILERTTDARRQPSEIHAGDQNGRDRVQPDRRVWVWPAADLSDDHRLAWFSTLN